MKDTILSGKTTINCGGKLISLDQPKVMGIVNCTPDSFYDGGKNNSAETALKQIEKHLKEGATLIDIGGYSSRPGAADVSIEEETERVVPIIKSALKEFPDLIISVDTFRSKVAKRSLDVGAMIINDISAGQLDDQMLALVINQNVPYIMMHMKHTPQNMQNSIHYDNVLLEIGMYFSEKVSYLQSKGVKDIILDPGFGFAKDLTHNYKLLGNLNHFDFLNLPLLAGISRKSMLYKPLNIESSQALNATTAANMIALMNGAKILRVHDVKEAAECVHIYNLTEEYKG